MVSNRCIILFVKYPEKGKVKTRLSAHLGDETTLNLYRCFVSDLIGTLVNSRYTFKIAFSPPDSEEQIISWLGSEHTYTPQVGRDLGERMENAFRETFLEGFNEVLIIGTDIPDISPSLLDKAFKVLENSDAVIGPCFDGGYYLIGCKVKNFLSDIFRGITWSTEEVFRKTLDVFLKNGYIVNVLPKLRDIDKVEDLRAFYRGSMDTKRNYSKTLTYLASIVDILDYES